MSELTLTRHARERVVEFGLGLDVVTAIASRPDVTHRNTIGQVVCTSDAHPDWTVVLGDDDVVVTVLRRLRDRWEHSTQPARPAARQTSSTATPAAVEDARQLDATPPAPAASRRRSTTRSARRRAASPATRLVDPDVLRIARELADGDLRRLVLNADGSVWILNRPGRSR